MFFEMLSDGCTFHVNIKELQDSWAICIAKKGEKESKKYKIMKYDYQKVNDVISLLFKNRSYIINIMKYNTDYLVDMQGIYKRVTIYNEEILLQKKLKKGCRLGEKSTLIASMPGKVVDILVKPGDKVKAGQAILVMEAMKMENEIQADHDALVKSINVKKNESVECGAVLVIFE